MRKLNYTERFKPAQRTIAETLVCPTCGAAPGQPCVFVSRADRLGQLMPGLHVERYPTETDG